ncbi:hypothetical protein KFK09_014829 [Dendrobium nobile]|uniref:SBP-type domain-containing protein n=1 Tax=Dendrobium nobile TaxID=94219 RepID=A0A8T3B906_DENNO|nr:hypothetical protein KFK09_014829 [Dendrobium nobile]
MLKAIHRMGTKSLVAHLYDQDKMMEIREKIIDDGGIVDETIICAEVLAETSSYVRGIGYGPKLIKKTKIVRSNALSERETELETSLKVIQEKYEEQSKIIKSQQKTIDWLEMIAEKMGKQPPNDDEIFSYSLQVVSSSGRRTRGLDCSVNLKLGGFGDFRVADKWKEQRRPFAMPMKMSVTVPAGGQMKRPPVLSGGSQNVSCLVDGCRNDLSHYREYHRWHKVYEELSKTPIVLVGGQE